MNVIVGSFSNLYSANLTALHAYSLVKVHDRKIDILNNVTVYNFL